MWQYLRGEGQVGRHVAMVVQEDHIAPLACADRLGREGRRVTMFIQTNGPAPLVSRYSVGTLLGRLSEAGVRLVFNEAVTAIDLPALRMRHVYSRRESVHEGFDSVVLACGALLRSDLYGQVEACGPMSMCWAMPMRPAASSSRPSRAMSWPSGFEGNCLPGVFRGRS
jgi:hypothetical protein